MKSELLRKALMSKMATGGNLGGDDKNAAASSLIKGKGGKNLTQQEVDENIEYIRSQKMSPKQWADYAKSKGWEPAYTGSSVPASQKIQMGKYIDYYDPKQYAPSSTGFVRLSDVGKQNVDYTSDANYKPMIKYGYNPSAASSTAMNTPPLSPKPRVIPSSQQSSTVTQNQPESPYKAYWDFGGSNPAKVYRDKAGKVVATEVYVGGKPYETTYGDPMGVTDVKQGSFNLKYIPEAGKQEITTSIPKKKGGIVARYEGGGGVVDYNMFNLDAESPNMSDMDVKDSGIEDLSFDKNSVTDKTTKTNGKSSGNKKFNLSKLGGSGPLSVIGETASSGIDALDRKDGRSSIAGQTGVGVVKGAAEGYQMAGVPGAIIMGTLRGVQGAARGVKERKERQKVGNISVQESAVASQEFDPLNPNKKPVKAENYNSKDYNKGLAGLFANGGMVKQISNSANKINYATGGTIKGPGTGTSDSIEAKVKPGTFIVPAKNADFAEKLVKGLLGKKEGKMNLNQDGGVKVKLSNGEYGISEETKNELTAYLGQEILEKLAPEAKENEMEKNKGGEMIKRADGSYSKRGLWDGIRGAKGSGKKPTPEMLKQEKEIKSELKKGGYVVKRSSERKGKTHVVIGPDGTKKYFGDSKLGQHPNDPARKKAFYARHEKNLKKNPYFRAFARETWAEGGTVGSKMNKEMLEIELMSKKAKGGTLTKSKAKEILHDKSVHGKPLTDKQRKYFGWVAGGKKNMGGIVGKYAMGGKVNRDWEWG